MRSYILSGPASRDAKVAKNKNGFMGRGFWFSLGVLATWRRLFILSARNQVR